MLRFVVALFFAVGIFAPASALEENYDIVYLDHLDRVCAAQTLRDKMQMEACNKIIAITEAGNNRRVSSHLEKDSKRFLAKLYRNRAVLRVFEWQETMDDINKAIALAPDDAANYLARGRHFIHMGMPERSLPDLSKVIELESDSLEAHFWSGRALHMAGSFDEALNEYRKVLTLKDELQQRAQYLIEHLESK